MDRQESSSPTKKQNKSLYKTGDQDGRGQHGKKYRGNSFTFAPSFLGVWRAITVLPAFHL